MEILRLWHTVNERTECILLECILVFVYFNFCTYEVQVVYTQGIDSTLLYADPDYYYNGFTGFRI